MAEKKDEQKDDQKVASSEDNYTYPTDHRDLVERRASQGRLGPQAVGGRSFALPGNEGDDYLGVSPEYANYANETDRPYRSPEGTPQTQTEAAAYAVQSGETATPTVEEVNEDQGDSEDDKGDKTSRSPGAQVTTTTHQASRASAPQGKSTTPKQ